MTIPSALCFVLISKCWRNITILSSKYSFTKPLAWKFCWMNTQIHLVSSSDAHHHNRRMSWIFRITSPFINVYSPQQLVWHTLTPPPPFSVSSDFVAVMVMIFVNETVELAAREFNFYNCAATVKKSENTPWVRLFSLSVLLCHSLKIHSDTEHSINLTTLM